MPPRKKKPRTDQAYIRWYEGRVALDWSGSRSVLRHQRDCKFCGTWSAASVGRPTPDPCPGCGKTAHLKDDDGTPWHKVCLEGHLTEILQPPGGGRP